MCADTCVEEELVERRASDVVVAHTNHDQPFWLLDTILIPLRVPQCLDFDVLGFLDLVCGSVADEDWLATPFDDNLRPFSILNDPRNKRNISILTFLPSGIVDRSTSTFAIAKTSAEADIFTRKSTTAQRQPAIPIDLRTTIHISIKPSLTIPLPSPSSSPSMRTKHTLNSSLRPSSRERAHSPHHKVLKHQVAIPTRLRPIMAKIRDLVRILVAGAAEWALERTRRVDLARCSSSVLRGCRTEAADAGEMRP
jgi:hypothetical protein